VRERAHHVIGAILLALCLVLSAAALIMALSGGVTIHLSGRRITAHAAWRPSLLALICGAAAAAFLRRQPAGRSEAMATTIVDRYGSSIAAAAAAAVAIGCFLLGAHIAFGADPSGYLSQARLWRTGNLTMQTPLALQVNTVHGQHAFTPLGYYPSGTRGVAVPLYPPGLPLHFAAAAALAGERAPFAIPPLSAAGVVVIAFLLGRRVGGHRTALVAAAACATSPILLFEAVQPMSDTTAAFWWSLAVLLLTRESIPAAACAGLATAIACLVRPNLFALVPVLALLAVWWRGSWRPLRRWVIYLLVPTATAVGFVLMQRSWYGGATTTGYGPVEFLFSLDHVATNLSRYARWAITAQSLLIVLPLAAPFVIRRHLVTPAIDLVHASRFAWAGLIFAAALQTFFLLYLVLDDWFSFRFLLPALPWLLVLQAAVLAAACRRLPSGLQTIGVLVIATLIASWGIDRARGLGAFGLRDTEQRYLDVVAFTRTLPANAVYITVHHSGSLPYYTSATIVRWDWLENDELDRVVSNLRSLHRPPFLVIDDFEEPQFRQRFAGTRTEARLVGPVFDTGTSRGISSRVYALSE
jgi:hypothetical protein